MYKHNKYIKYNAKIECSINKAFAEIGDLFDFVYIIEIDQYKKFKP